MARLPRLYRVVGVLNANDIEHRNYLTPEAAREQAERMKQAGREVTVTESYPVQFPHPAGDRASLPIPDGTITEFELRAIGRLVGVSGAALRSIVLDGPQLVVTYQPTPAPGKTLRNTPTEELRIEVIP